MARFLFPEDDEGIAELCSFAVVWAGHVLDPAATGTEGRDLARSLEYDAIVTDGSMPGLDGPGLLADIRPLVRDRVPCALKSGSHYSDWPELEVEWYLAKPFEFGDLVELCIEMVAARVERLLAWCPEAARPLSTRRRRAGGQSLSRSLRLRFEHVRHGEIRHFIHAPSPRAAVRYLMETVDDWPSLLKTPERLDVMSSSQRRERSVRFLTPSDQEVRLGDAQLRRVAARLPEPLRTRMYLALCCSRFGWRWQLAPDALLVVDPPREAVHQNGELTCESGPALRYRDGWSLYALRGQSVRKRAITAPETITIEEIRRERHVEVRRILRQLFGDDRYIAECGAGVLDVDTVPVDALAPGGRSISRALIVDDEDKRYLVASDGSTRRVYHMLVPETCQTCREAYEALSGRPGMRTIVEA